jgi:ketosteroid isomerase-like protein
VGKFSGPKVISRRILHFDDRRNNTMDRRILGVTIVSFLLYPVCFAQNRPIASEARKQIDAGNQAWIDGMKQSNVGLITATYTLDAVDCNPQGECIRGRSAIEEHINQEIAKLGKADSASVTSIGSVQQGHFIYEWGHAEAHFPSGKKIVDRYLTAWQEQPDGEWKIFRNLVIPDR